MKIEVKFEQLDRIDKQLDRIERKVDTIMAGTEDLNAAVEGVAGEVADVANALASQSDEIQEVIDALQNDADPADAIERLTALKDSLATSADGLRTNEANLRAAIPQPATPTEPAPGTEV